MRLIEHEHYSKMFYIEFEDGIKSEMFYNLTRATELLNRLKNGENVNTVRIGYEVPN